MGLRRDGGWLPKGLCRHCRRASISRPRRLCWCCFYTPEIQALYPPMPPADAGRKGGLQPKKRKWTQTPDPTRTPE